MSAPFLAQARLAIGSRLDASSLAAASRAARAFSTDKSPGHMAPVQYFPCGEVETFRGSPGASLKLHQAEAVRPGPKLGAESRPRSDVPAVESSTGRFNLKSHGAYPYPSRARRAHFSVLLGGPTGRIRKGTGDRATPVFAQAGREEKGNTNPIKPERESARSEGTCLVGCKGVQGPRFLPSVVAGGGVALRNVVHAGINGRGLSRGVPSEGPGAGSTPARSTVVSGGSRERDPILRHRTTDEGRRGHELSSRGAFVKRGLSIADAVARKDMRR